MMDMTDFENTKRECLKSFTELYRECTLLAHRSVRALDAVNKARTECELESAEDMVLSLAETFKHIEIMGRISVTTSRSGMKMKRTAKGGTECTGKR